MRKFFGIVLIPIGGIFALSTLMTLPKLIQHDLITDVNTPYLIGSLIGELIIVCVFVFLPIYYGIKLIKNKTQNAGDLTEEEF